MSSREGLRPSNTDYMVQLSLVSDRLRPVETILYIIAHFQTKVISLSMDYLGDWLLCGKVLLVYQQPHNHTQPRWHNCYHHGVWCIACLNIKPQRKQKNKLPNEHLYPSINRQQVLLKCHRPTEMPGFKNYSHSIWHNSGKMQHFHTQLIWGDLRKMQLFLNPQMFCWSWSTHIPYNIVKKYVKVP